MSKLLRRILLNILDADQYSPRTRRIARALGLSDWYLSRRREFRPHRPYVALDRRGLTIDVGRWCLDVDFKARPRVPQPWQWPAASE
jgi:hypothetical protein